MRVIILICSCILINYSCLNRSDDKSPPELAAQNQLEVPINTGNFEILKNGQTKKTIFLETKEAIINQIDKIIAFDDYLYVLDLSQNNLYLFNDEGNFLRKISSYGKGPGEYLRISDILYSRNDSCLEILDAGGQKILKVNNDGNLISTTKLPFFCEFFFKPSSDKYWFFSNNQTNVINSKDFRYNLIRTQNKMESIDGFMLIPPNRENFGVDNPGIFSSPEETANFSLPFDHKIYEVSNDSVYAIFDITFGKKSLPESFFKGFENVDIMSQMELLNNFNKTEYASLIHRILVNKSYLYFQYWQSQNIHAVLFNRITNKLEQYGKLSGIRKDPVLLTSDNLIYYVLYPHEMANTDSDKFLNEEERELLKSVSEFDNLIIQIIKINK